MVLILSLASRPSPSQVILMIPILISEIVRPHHRPYPASQDTGYPAFADQMLKSARAMPDSSARAAIGVAMQDALEAVVLNGVQPAQAATRAVDAVKTGQASQP